MPILREDKGRDYRRWEHTKEERQRLDNAGFTPVLSSNVSAIGEHNGDLYIRFHGGNSYVYPNSGELYLPMLQSPSKGRFVWQRLRRTGVPYQRIANVRLPKDIPSTDINMLPETIQVTSDVMQELLRQNADIVRKMQERFIDIADIKTLITDRGVFQLANSRPTVAQQTVGMIYNNDLLSTLLLDNIIA